MNLEINFTISTNKDMECFWGYSKKIKVLDYDRNGHICFIKNFNQVCELIIDSLKEDCKLFPIMIEKIQQLNFDSHGDFYDVIFNNINNPNFIYYICHH